MPRGCQGSWRNWPAQADLASAHLRVEVKINLGSTRAPMLRRRLPRIIGA